ncbi:hypothetical protein BGZ63DRAFT_404501 [Mariannaea sp. PMI_226]|nr:hypothetical protein BGZ63DRAFT_404501 [Mariannaea sp. PMI_226]
MAGGKNEGSQNPSAIRIRDNQRRSRARHKEYVDGLQRKVQEYERRGIEATLEMQQAARTVALENSRLRILLSHHGIADDEVDKFLQTFPDQAASEAAKATISHGTANQSPIASVLHNPKIPIQPLSRPPSTGPSPQTYNPPAIAREGSTREVLDAIVGIKRESRPSVASIASKGSSAPSPAEQRWPILPRHENPILPILPALVLGQTRPEPNPIIDRIPVLGTTSVGKDHGNIKHHRTLSSTDSLHVPSPPAIGQSPPSLSAEPPTRLSSASPRSYGRRSRSPLDRSVTPTQRGTGENLGPTVERRSHDAIPVRTLTLPPLLDKP